MVQGTEDALIYFPSAASLASNPEKQHSFASLSFESKKKPVRCERFLGEMDKVVPWAALLELIEPGYRFGSSRLATNAGVDDVADPLHATVVRVGWPSDGGRALRNRVDGAVRRAGAK